MLYIGTCLIKADENNEAAITVKEGTTVIAGRAFDGMDNLKSVKLPDSLISIGSIAFSFCDALSDVSIPKTVKRIGHSSFSYTALYKDEKNWDGDVLYIDNCLVETKSWTNTQGKYEVRKGTRIICEGAFVNHDKDVYGLSYFSYDEIVIPDSVKIIGDNAFADCGELKKITIPASVTYIGEDVFWKNGKDVAIHGYSGSYAQKYAKAHNIAFVELSGTPDLPPDKPSVEEPVIGKIEGAKTVTSGGVEVLAALDGVTVATVRKAAKNAKLLDKNGNAVSDTSRLATGMKLVFDNKTVTIAVLGDVDGNGVIGVADARLALRAAVSLEKLGGVYLLAAEVGNNSVGVSQAREILRVAVGLDNGKSWLK